MTDQDVTEEPEESNSEQYEEETESQDCTEEPAIIIDNGSFSIHAGLAGDDAPRVVQRSVVGTLRNDHYQFGHNNITGKKSYFIGDEAISKRGLLSFKYPIEKGVIEDWDTMEQLWHSLFYEELRVQPEEHSVLLTEPSLHSKAQREKATQEMFETFNVPRFYLCASALLAMYAAGRTTGLAIDCGYDITQIVPIYEGYMLPHAVQRLGIGGRDITQQLLARLKRDDLVFAKEFGCSSKPSSSEQDIVREIKEKLCCVAATYPMSDDDVGEELYELPDGKHCTLGANRYESTEIMFSPYLCGKEAGGMHECAFEALKKSDEDIRQELTNNIVMTGGNSMLNGLSERVTEELSAVIPASWRSKVKVVSPPERKFSAFIGGSIIGALSVNQLEDWWIEKDEYDECGPYIVHRKCT
mmetsp:Transcript_41206/g.67778  ORF Transcript_41206/g.67778 Transcript_41206/m.67778 type:complete len:413 (-) Transcript_41206:68-1306(-)